MSQLEMRDAMFRYATEGILICDNDGVIQLTNPAVRNMFGYEENDLKGQKIEVLLPQRHRRAHIGMRTDYSRRPEPRKMGYGRDLFATKKDGTEIMVEVSLSPF
ncbi:MAG TPA: PAS domain S-box protein, partial [Bacteroidia bacterium]|nr:PAS domain S-box protein [Bacteroidia bacterium]